MMRAIRCPHRGREHTVQAQDSVEAAMVGTPIVQVPVRVGVWSYSRERVFDPVAMVKTDTVIHPAHSGNINHRPDLPRIIVYSNLTRLKAQGDSGFTALPSAEISHSTWILANVAIAHIIFCGIWLAFIGRQQPTGGWCDQEFLERRWHYHHTLSVGSGW